MLKSKKRSLLSSKFSLLTVGALMAGLFFIAPVATGKVSATPVPQGCPGTAHPVNPPPTACNNIPLGCPGSTKQGPPSADFNPSKCPYEAVAETDSCADLSGSADECKIVKKYLLPAINLLSASVGIIVTIMIIIGGIEYSTAGGDPARTSAAKGRIANAVFALLAFAFLWSFLQWLVPGGIL